jgi:N6-adenosine-specific RNA methylase IME4
VTLVIDHNMSKKFEVIVADCPWSFSDKLTMSDVARGAAANYNLMSNSDIEQLPIKNFISPDGSILALWVPSSLLQEGLNTMKAWGFAHKQTYVWVKTKKQPFEKAQKLFSSLISMSNKMKIGSVSTLKDYKRILYGTFMAFQLSQSLAFGMGRLFRQTHEICLIGTSSNKVYKQLESKSQRSVSFGENLKHSAKPEHLQDSLELMFPAGNYLELFARRHRPGWTCLGNEICNGEDIRVSLSKL